MRNNESLFRNVLYILLYTALIIVPLYRIFKTLPFLGKFYQLLLLVFLVFVFGGMLLDRAELIIVYFVVAATILQANRVIMPSPGEFLIYSLVVLHGDIIAKVIIYKGYSRKIGFSMLSMGFILLYLAVALIIYISAGYLSAELVVGLKNASIVANPLSYLVMGAFLHTRAGSLVLVVISALFISYILTNYISAIASDIVGLNVNYARAYIARFISGSYQLMLKANTWHDRMFKYIIFLSLTLILWVLLEPLYEIVFTSISFFFRYLSLEVSMLLINLISFISGLIVAYVAYRLLKRAIENIAFTSSKARPTLSDRLSLGWVIIPAVLLIGYLLFLQVYPPIGGISGDTFLRSFGLLPPKSGESWPKLLAFLNGLPYYARLYVDRVVEEFNWLVYLTKALINILWGG